MAAALLSSCSSFPEPIEITTRPVEKPQLILPEADEFIARQVEFFVLTEDNIDEQFAELERRGSHLVFFAMSAQGYENVSLNLSDLRAYILQQNAIIAAYEDYYTETQEVLDDAVIVE